MSTEPQDPVGHDSDSDHLRGAPGGSEGATAAGSVQKSGRLRAVSSWIVLVLACVLALLSVVAVYARNEVLNTDTFVATVGPLARTPAIQQEVAQKVSTELTQGINLQGRIQHYLPSQLDFIAAPVAQGAASAVDAATLKVVQSSQFQRLWIASLRNSHQQAVDLLTGKSEGAFTSSNGQVTVNLEKVEATVKARLKAEGLGFVTRIPNVKSSELVLFKSQQLLRVQKLVSLVNKISLLLPVLTILAFAAAVVLAKNRRKGFARAMVGLALSMAAFLVTYAVARNIYLGSQVRSLTTEAEAAIIDTVAARLVDTVRLIMWVAVVFGLVAIAAGNRTVKGWVGGVRPAWLTQGPFHDGLARARRPLQWAILAIALVVLVTWSHPTVLAVVVTLLVALVLIGLLGLLVALGADPRSSGSATAPTPSAGASS